VFGLGIATWKQFNYFFSSSSPFFTIANPVFYSGSYRKIQQNDAIWEELFGLDTVIAMISNSRFLI